MIWTVDTAVGQWTLRLDNGHCGWTVDTAEFPTSNIW